MKILFLMDPLETVVMKKDTSFILMLGAYRKNHEIFFLPNGGMTRINGKTKFKCTPVIPQQMEQQPFITKDPVTLSEEDVDAVFVRTDPPFDQQYLLNTWLLDRLPERIFVINNPAGIRTVNEKLWATQFTALIPHTVVSRQEKELLDFIHDEREVVAKPTDGFGGQSIFHIKKGDKNTKVTLETMTAHWSKEIILQAFVPESKDGDKRILLLNGEPLGAVLRVQSEGDHRNNFLSGGKAVKTLLTKRDDEIISALRPALIKLGLYFVGIDIMGDYLIEVNVTSPTCLQEINRFEKKSLENNVIDFVEKCVEEFKTKAKIAG